MNLITNYTNHLKPLAKNTQTVYLSEFKAFVKYFAGEDYRYISRDSIIEYLARLYDQGYSASKVNQSINAIKFYKEKILGQKRTTYFLKRPRRQKFIPPILSPEQMAQVITTPKNLKHSTILYFIYDNGLRISEAQNLKLSNVRTRTQNPHIIILNTKHGGDRVLYLSAQCLEKLQIYYHKFKPQTYLFEGAEANKPISKTTITKILDKAIKQNKIIARFRVHDLRHNFATHCLINGTNIYDLSRQLGHRNVQTTQKYYAHLLPNQIKINRPVAMSVVLEKHPEKLYLKPSA